MAESTGIMFVIDELRPGGAEHVLLELAQSLRNDGKYRPIVACLKLAGPLAEQFEWAGIKIYQRLLRDRYDGLVIYRLMRIISEENIKIIVAVGSGGNRMFWATIVGKLAGIKFVVWSHTYSQPNHPEFETVNRVLFPLVDRIVALGTRHKECLAWRDKAPAGKISIIQNGINIKKFDHPQWRDKARAKLGLADENIVAIAMIANLRESKRHDIFIEAARKIVERNRNVHFFIIGDGPNRKRVRQLVERSELQGQFLSLIGHRNDIAELLPGLDIVCICSEYQECLSLVAIQAMVSGVLVVSNVIGSMDELIEDNRTGFFYHPLSSQALADKLLYVMDNPQLKEQIVANAKDRVKQNFTADVMTKKFISLFDSLLASGYKSTEILAEVKRIGK